MCKFSLQFSWRENIKMCFLGVPAKDIANIQRTKFEQYRYVSYFSLSQILPNVLHNKQNMQWSNLTLLYKSKTIQHSQTSAWFWFASKSINNEVSSKDCKVCVYLLNGEASLYNDLWGTQMGSQFRQSAAFSSAEEENWSQIVFLCLILIRNFCFNFVSGKPICS